MYAAGIVEDLPTLLEHFDSLYGFKDPNALDLIKSQLQNLMPIRFYALNLEFFFCQETSSKTQIPQLIT